ncbi:MAG: SPOR domain-containing protein [Desulfobacterales bacterium]|nr:SPOR domain-containing protein [Desulfobacterales bacterium]
MIGHVHATRPSPPSRPMGMVLLVILCLSPSGCMSRHAVTYQEMSQAAPQRLPHSIAVLPFHNATERPDLAPLVRQGFYAHLSYKRFRDVELSVIDQVLAEHGLGADTEWTAERIRRLGDWLNCEAVVIGRINRFERLFAAVYSQFNIGAQITIHATRTGQPIWSDRHVARLHEGDVPLTPLGLPLASIRTGMNLHDREVIAVVDLLTRHLAGRIPDHGLPGPAPGTYRLELQIGAYRDHQFALAERDRLKAEGFPASVRSETTPDAIWHRVVIGPYLDEDEAMAARTALEGLLSVRPLIRRQPL